MPHVRVKGTDIEYRVLKTRLNRYIRLTVSGKDGVRVSAPWGVPERDLHAMVREKGAWILDRLEHFRQLELQQPRWTFSDGQRVLIMGEWRTLRIISWEWNAGKVALEGGEVIIRVPFRFLRDEKVLSQLFYKWIRRWAEQELRRRVGLFSGQMKLAPARITVRAQRSKWGSCNAEGNINLNMRLMLAPPEVIDYVVIHELAHLRELNHSKRFWALVEQHCPDSRTQKNWLREHTWLLEMS
ncbi:MAG: M48 family metallopeptidase [Bacteroidetes bacterium]|nr:M48 family metallopeptidase [Bacteroidota bacterium]